MLPPQQLPLTSRALMGGSIAAAVPEVAVPETEPLSDLLADLDDPSLVLSEGYIGADRRSGGLWARLRRVSFPSRRSLLRLEAVVVALVVVVVSGALVLVRTEPSPPQRRPPTAPLTLPMVLLPRARPPPRCRLQS